METVADFPDGAPALATPSGCRRPLVLVRRPGPNAGPVMPDTNHVAVPCGSRYDEDCPACADTYRKRSHLLIVSGLPKPGEYARGVLLTLTAPSFGPVHVSGWKAGKPKPARPRMCRCGRVHNPETQGGRDFIGAALDPDTYEYAAQVAWNANAGDLWRTLQKRIRRAVGRDVNLQFTRIQEPQTRGAQHFHVVITARQALRPDADGVVSPHPLPMARDLARAIALTLPHHQDAKRCHCGQTDQHRHAARVGIGGPEYTPANSPEPLAFGEVWDVRPLTPVKDDKGKEHWGGIAKYLAKYLTKSTGGTTSKNRPGWASATGKHLERCRVEAVTQRVTKRIATDPARVANVAARYMLRYPYSRVTWPSGRRTFYGQRLGLTAPKLGPIIWFRAATTARGLVAHYGTDELHELAHAAGFSRVADLSRAKRGLGWVGHPRTASRGFGLTMKELKETANRWRRAQLGLPPDPPPDLWLWTLDAQLTRKLRQDLLATRLANARDELTLSA